MTSTRKYPIVLTADRTLMSEYGGGIFLGFSACVPRGLIPDRLFFSLVCPPIDVNKDGSVDIAPCGTRKIEAALLDYGFRREDVIVAHPEHLDKVIGPETKVLGVTENDPLGIGPATSTFTQIFGGEAYMAVKFRELLSHSAITEFRPRVIVGGPGAWQLEDEETRRKLGIDSVVIGEGEKLVGSLFDKALNSEKLPSVVNGEMVEENEIPLINGATVNGIVEIARGCGRGCDFCVPTLRRFRCLPIDRILKEVEVNLRADRQPLLHAEDVLRYGAKGIEANREAVINLFKSVMSLPGVESIDISHFSLSTVAASPEIVEEISNILDTREDRWLSGQTGIETGSPELMRRHMKGKCKPFKPEEWPEAVVNAFQILSENNWVPCSTLILGFPGETGKDIESTISLFEMLKPFKSLIVPLFLVSMGELKDKCDPFTLEQVTPKHTELLLECWKHNFEWIPTILKEWSEFSIKNRIMRHGLGLLISYGSKKVKELIQKCERDYNYDLQTMIRDFKKGSAVVPASLPVRLLRPLLKMISD